MGLTKEGFVKKTYSDLLNEMELKAKELFGEDINTKSYTPLGIIIRIFAWFLAIAWDTIEKVYNSRFIKKADGKSLDYHGGDKSLPRNSAEYAYTTLQFTGKPGYTVETEELFVTDSEVYFMLLEDVTLDEEGNGEGEAVSVETGAVNNVLSHTVTKQAEPVEELYTVSNPEPANGGSDQEQDYMYRQRLLQSNESKAKATQNAMIAALLNTPAVRAVSIVVNNKMTADTDGNPPKSVHAYVLGGAKENIAASLLDSVAGGIETVGQERVNVLDMGGNNHIICFDYAAVTKIYIKLTVTPNSKFSQDGVNQLKNSMIKKIGGTDVNEMVQIGLEMGEDVILSQLYSSAFQVAGIDDIIIEIGTSQDSLSASNISISQSQIAETDSASIEVVVSA